jgi:hypothetical protein
MPTTFPVKWINNAMRGAPQVSGTAGSLIAALDAFLVSGFGAVTAQSVTVTGGIATANLQAGQSFDKNVIVLVDGSTPAALNGEARVLTSSSSQITWATTAPDGVATGTITIKVAPVGGWAKVFAGTNKAVYQSTDVQGARFFYRVDDTGTTTARVRGYESMSDVDTGTGPFPTDAQISGGGYLLKSSAANTAAARYDFLADSRFCLLAIAPASAATASFTGAVARGFGDVLPLRPAGDVYSACCSVADSSGLSASGAFDQQTGGGAAVYAARGPSGLGGAVRPNAWAYVGAAGQSGVTSTLGAFPSTIDGELKVSRRYLDAGDGGTPRANIPGILHVPQSGVSAAVAPRDTFDGTGEFAGRVLYAVPGVLGSVSATPNGIYLFDATGPWR